MNTVLLDLESRAARYGGTLGDILAETPSYLWDSPTEQEEIATAEIDNQLAALEIDSMITDDSADFAAEVIELVTA